MMDPQSNKGWEGWVRAGPRGWAWRSPSPTSWLFHLNDTCEANLVWSTGRRDLLVGLTKEGWACQMESGSGRLEEPSLSSAPVIKCQIKEETFLPPSCPLSLSSSGPFTRLLPKNMDRGAFCSSPSQLTLPPRPRGVRRLIKTR